MVFLVTDIYESEGVRGNTPWVIKFAITSTLATEGSQESSLRIKYLEKIIVLKFIGNYLSLKSKVSFNCKRQQHENLIYLTFIVPLEQEIINHRSMKSTFYRKVTFFIVELDPTVEKCPRRKKSNQEKART